MRANLHFKKSAGGMTTLMELKQMKQTITVEMICVSQRKITSVLKREESYRSNSLSKCTQWLSHTSTSREAKHFHLVTQRPPRPGTRHAGDQRQSNHSFVSACIETITSLSHQNIPLFFKLTYKWTIVQYFPKTLQNKIYTQISVFRSNQPNLGLTEIHPCLLMVFIITPGSC